MANVMIAKIATSPFGRIASIAAAAILPHLPCVLIASGIWTLGAGVAAFLTNPWTIGAAVFASLWTGTIAHRKICDWRCAFDACIPSANLQTTVRHKSFDDLLADTAARSRGKMRRNAGLTVAYAATAAASAIYMPPLLHDHSAHCAPITSLDPERRILLACPNSDRTILVALSPENRVVFIDGAAWGVQKMEMCNAPPQMMVMGAHRTGGVKPLSAEEATKIFRAWSCCTIEKEMNAIDASDLADPIKAAFKDAVEKAWMGNASDPVICTDPAMIKSMQNRQNHR